MKYKYILPKNLISKIEDMEEFANSATQVSIKLNDGRVVNKVLISQSRYIIALRGYKDLPFNIDDIVEIFQLGDDKNPVDRGNWDYWDQWKK